jgi:hypothetical protein
MSNFRVKDVKFGRPVATKDRLPTESDATPEGLVLAWSHLRRKWEHHIIEVLKRWPQSYPYWRRSSS